MKEFELLLTLTAKSEPDFQNSTISGLEQAQIVANDRFLTQNLSAVKTNR